MIFKNDIEFSDSKFYDIKIISLGLTFEVKNDILAAKTGNVAIEYKSRGKDSGLVTSTADYWVYKFNNECLMIKTSNLRKELIDNKNYFRIVSGGDNSTSQLFLVKISTFKTWGEIIS
jgi:hypothetical protein